MTNRKALRISDKTPSQQFKIKLAANVIHSIINFMDKRAKRHLINFHNENEPAIYAVWHGLQLAAGCFPIEMRKNLHILISLSNDGEIISQVCDKLGFSLVRGSHQREGEQATREMLSILNDGGNIVFTIDGPIGPKHKAKKGIIKLAKMSQRPIIPISTRISKSLKINSWDEMEIPVAPVPKTSLIFGEPIYVPKDADIEKEKECRLNLEKQLFDLYDTIQIKHKEIWGENG